jgi:putative endonuclease
MKPLFMVFFFYIIYSPSADKFYYGHTEDLEARFTRHNQKSKGFTGNINDWEVVYTEIFQSKTEAYARERQVKNWKSRKRVVALIEKKSD